VADSREFPNGGLGCKVVHSPNVFPLLARNSLITLSGPYPIMRYKISINVLTSSVSITAEIFYDTVRDYKKIAG